MLKISHSISVLILKQPQIILLKEGTDSSQGKPQIISNINACQAIAEAVRTTLGPRGMDKLIVDSKSKFFLLDYQKVDYRRIIFQMKIRQQFQTTVPQ